MFAYHLLSYTTSTITTSLSSLVMKTLYIHLVESIFTYQYLLSLLSLSPTHARQYIRYQNDIKLEKSHPFYKNLYLKY